MSSVEILGNIYATEDTARAIARTEEVGEERVEFMQINAMQRESGPMRDQHDRSRLPDTDPR